MIHSNPTVSVLVTVYNRERYLASCLDSILNSTFQNLEVIVVDDCSTDNSLEIAERYQRHAQVKVLHNKQNLGDYPNRMRAASLARGKFIKYVDSDDRIYSHSLSIMVEAMEAHPDAALGLSHSLPEAEQPYPWKLAPAESWRKHYLGQGCLGCGPSGAIIRRDAFETIGGFRDWGVLSDTDLWSRMAARWPLLLLAPGLVWWRRHSDQEFTRGDAGTVYLEKGFELAMAALRSDSTPLSADERVIAIARARHHHARRLLSLALLSRQPSLAIRLWAKAGLPIGNVFGALRKYE